jgi:hypothetical protein
MFTRKIGIIGLIVIFILLIVFSPVVEGFTSSSTEECLAKGYTKEFCLQNPLPGMCRCDDGSVGTIIPGFKGECIC